MNKQENNTFIKKNNIKQIINLIFKAVGVGMGIAVVVLNILTELQVNDAITMLGIGLACIGISLLPDNKEDSKNNIKK